MSRREDARLRVLFFTPAVSAHTMGREEACMWTTI